MDEMKNKNVNDYGWRDIRVVCVVNFNDWPKESRGGGENAYHVN